MRVNSISLPPASLSEPSSAAASAARAVRYSPFVLASPQQGPSTRECLTDVLLPPVDAAAPLPRKRWRRVASGVGFFTAGILLGARVCVAAPVLIAEASIGERSKRFDRTVPLRKALAPFLARAPQWRDKVNIEALALTEGQTRAFAYFLCRINQDIRKLSRGGDLSGRLMEMTVAMQGNAELKTLLIDTMYHTFTACHDRRNRGINELHQALLSYRAQHATNAEGALRALARQLLQLEVVHACAAAKASNDEAEASNDQVERYLQFEVYVNARVPLPLWTTEAKYTWLFKVPRSELDAAVQAVGRVTDAHVENYLASWAPWQKHMRSKLAQEVRYDMLPRTTLAQDPDATCPVTLSAVKEIDEAVLQTTAPTPHVYDYEALMHWWVMHGTDPVTRQALALAPEAI